MEERRVLLKTITRYHSLEQFLDFIKQDSIFVGDELVTEDTDGKAIFQVADVRKKSIIMVRKFCLADDKRMKTDSFDLMSWLQSDYLITLPEDLRKHIKRREGLSIFLPREVEVFGDYIYSNDIEKGKQWAIFKKTKQRIRLRSDKEGSACAWWESSPGVSDSTAFCVVSSDGSANYSGASGAFGVLPCFKIER